MYLPKPFRLAIALANLMLCNFVAIANPEKIPNPEKYQQRTLSFFENKGQITDQYSKPRTDIDFGLISEGVHIFIGEGAIHYQWNRNQTKFPDVYNWHNDKTRREELKQELKTDVYRLDVVLSGANKNATFISDNKAESYENYYLETYEGQVHSFGKITYKDIYPNIDWVLYTNNGALKYDFIVHPGGNPKDIKLQYNGATTLALKDGAINAVTPLGSITEQKPYSYNATTLKEVPSSFNLTGHTLSFNVTTDSQNDIVIDPVLQWATYYGSTNTDLFYDVATNSVGDAYVCGWTQSTTNIATTGTHQATINGSYDAFITKFNSAGVRQWSTYLGGSGQDWLYSAECDASGNLYLSGETSSTGVATTGVHQTTIGGGFDALLVKMNSSGARVWATYFGGTGNEDCNVACDGLGNVYITGETFSNSGIATTGSFQSTYSGGFDAYLAKFSSSGTLFWSTYFGNTGDDDGHNITCDANNDVYFCGGTNSTSGIATTGAYQTTRNGVHDAFIAKFNGSGTRLWSTYYGGNNRDDMHAIVCDLPGNLYLTGYTNSTSGIASTGAYQTASAGNNDAFLAKFNSSGVRQWSTFYGGSGNDYGTGIKIGPDANVYISGYSTSSSGIATLNGHKTSIGGPSDMVVSQFDNSNGTLKWGTYYGDPGAEVSTWVTAGGSGGHSWVSGGFIDISANGKLYVVGSTTGATDVATTGAHQTTIGGGMDGYLTSWLIDTAVIINQPFGNLSLCTGSSFSIPYSVSETFVSGNIFTAQLSNSTGSFASPVNIGSVTATGNGSISVTIPLTTLAGTGYRIRISASNPSRISADNGSNITIAPPPTIVAGSNSPLCEGATLNLSASNPSSATGTWDWTGPNGYNITSVQNPFRSPATVSMSGRYIVSLTGTNNCISTDTIMVAVNLIPSIPVAGSNTPVCPNTPLTLTATSSTSGVSYSWTGPNGYSSTLQNPTVSLNATPVMAGAYTVVANKTGCNSAAATTNVAVYITTPTPVASSNSPVCTGHSLDLTATTITGATYYWYGPNGFTSASQNPSISNTQLSHGGTYKVYAVKNGCVSETSAVTVVTTPAPFIGSYASPSDTICQGFTATFLAFPQNPGTVPSYQWYKNHIPEPGATNLIYATSNLSTGDQIYCGMTVTGVCNNTTFLTTDTIVMTVLPIITVPSVKIQAAPGLAVSPLQEVKFTAVVNNGGTTPKFQWNKNGKVLPGAKYATLILNGLVFGDMISVDIISEDPCAGDNKAASDTVYIGHPTGIASTYKKEVLSLYPNPNKGSFTVTGIVANDVTIEIVNAIGQVVYKDMAEHLKGELTIKSQLAQGVYLIRLSNKSELNQTIRFTIAE